MTGCKQCSYLRSKSLTPIANTCNWTLWLTTKEHSFVVVNNLHSINSTYSVHNILQAAVYLNKNYGFTHLRSVINSHKNPKISYKKEHTHGWLIAHTPSDLVLFKRLVNDYNREFSHGKYVYNENIYCSQAGLTFFSLGTCEKEESDECYNGDIKIDVNCDTANKFVDTRSPFIINTDFGVKDLLLNIKSKLTLDDTFFIHISLDCTKGKVLTEGKVLTDGKVKITNMFLCYGLPVIKSRIKRRFGVQIDDWNNI